MARVCAVCAKGKNKATKRLKTRSQYNPTESYFQKANLQWLSLTNGQRIKVCSKCRRALIKKKLEIRPPDIISTKTLTRPKKRN
ncbi:MAG: hypothetical protein M1505_00380 [Patescibacteria group bacterium]|nr:hypothetical protein [Patescibacteria group bacterium]MCL5257686.1 hypothetical protein [Patescibacteria group bacterium]